MIIRAWSQILLSSSRAHLLYYCAGKLHYCEAFPAYVMEMGMTWTMAIGKIWSGASFHTVLYGAVHFAPGKLDT